MVKQLNHAVATVFIGEPLSAVEAKEETLAVEKIITYILLTLQCNSTRSNPRLNGCRGCRSQVRRDVRGYLNVEPFSA